MLRTAVFWFALVSLAFMVWISYDEFQIDLRCLTGSPPRAPYTYSGIIGAETAQLQREAARRDFEQFCQRHQTDIWTLFGHTLVIMACGFLAFWARPDIAMLRKLPRWRS